jgi:ribonuclease PH
MRESRHVNEPRPCSIELNVSRYAEGSCIITTGHTKVFCTASIEEEIPKWLKGKKSGWVTAEYSMLPRATHTRSKRDREKVSGRTSEIQRLIARAIRAMVDLEKLGERQIIVDCDVLQADGGTRTASITGACVALAIALKKLIDAKEVPASVFIDTVQAISVGLKDGEAFVDLDYDEDSACDVDMNFVRTGSGLFVEVQGTAEKKPFSEADLKKMMDGAKHGLDRLKATQVEILQTLKILP